MKDKELETDYKNRINRVFEFIDENLDGDLSLSAVAEVAFFSPFHFHRVFKFMTGETLNTYVTRRRIEKAALALLHKNISASEIAHQLGFSDNTSFSRTFKKHYGVSPTAFQKQNPNRHSKIRQLESKNGQAYPDRAQYICVINHLKNWISMNAKIEVSVMPKMNLAYVTSVGAHNLAMAYQKLMQWAVPKELVTEHTKMVTIYHDSFKVTAPNKVRMSASILLQKPEKAEGEIGLMTLEAKKCIIARFEISLNEFEKSWTSLFLWMNEQGYKKADENPFEVYHNNFNEHPEKKAIVDFCIPVE